MEEAFETLFRTATVSGQGGIRTVANDPVEQVTPDQIRTAMLGEPINEHVDQYFKAVKATDVLCNRLLCNDERLTSIASFVQTQSMDVINDQQKLEIFR